MPLTRLVERVSKGHLHQGQLLLVWIIVFTLAVGYGFYDDKQQDLAIQESRATSCQRTYEGVREIFDEFRPETDTADWRRFDKRIDELKARCDEQTDPTNGGGDIQ